MKIMIIIVITIFVSDKFTYLLKKFYFFLKIYEKIQAHASHLLIISITVTLPAPYNYGN